METQEQWKSPRRIAEEAELAYMAKIEQRRQLRMKVGTALCDVMLDHLMTSGDAKRVYRTQFPEVNNEVVTNE